MVDQERPTTASKLVLMLESGEIDIFDALEYAPFLVTNNREMTRLKSRSKSRQSVRMERSNHEHNPIPPRCERTDQNAR